MNLDKPDTQIKLFLWLIALHSFSVGIGLILFPPSYLEFFGFSNYRYSFFQAQGGIFHLVMSVAYVMAIKYMDRSPGLIIFSISAKFIATAFLLIYYLFMENSWMIIMSAFGDAAMAIILYVLYKRFRVFNDK
jgi:hypothetical protein